MIKVLIVDDSALVRRMLSEIFAQTDDIEVIGTAPDPYVAREKIKRLNPDVLTLDVEMPRMDGLTFLSNLMRLRPMPVVMISSLTEQGAETTLRALELGAVDFVAKPRLDLAAGLDAYAEEILAKVRAAARARVHRRASRATTSPIREQGHFRTTDRIIGIGASTGGTEAIREVLEALPPGMPGIVIAQHIPAAFSASFARRLDGLCALKVSEARDGRQILPGHVFVAPGDSHLEVARDGARYLCRVHDAPPVNRHRPSVEVTMDSIARNVGRNAIGLMLTGMGADGAEAMGRMAASGAHVIAQDERTSVVWGMPGEVAKRGYAHEVLPLGKIAGRLVELARE